MSSEKNKRFKLGCFQYDNRNKQIKNINKTYHAEVLLMIQWFVCDEIINSADSVSTNVTVNKFL